MRWKKLGQIFNPLEHDLPDGCIEYAQSPQVLTFDDHIRVYFSTRSVDPRNGKYLSHIAYADMDREMSSVTSVSTHTVLPLGELGAFDEHGIFPLNVLRDGDRILGYTCGWNRRVSVSVDTAIGHVTSNDNGRTFQRTSPGPVMAASLNEPFLVGDGFVLVIDGEFHMWYIFGTEWRRYSDEQAPDRTYKIGHARSDDGVTWVKEEGRAIISNRLGEEESQALPTVVKIDGRFHMFFCYRESSGFRKDRARGYRIGHAYSDDLSTWLREDENPLLEGTPGEWDSDMQCYPHVFELDGSVYLLYNGNEFGRYGFGLAVLETQ